MQPNAWGLSKMSSCNQEQFKVALAACVEHARNTQFRTIADVADVIGASKDVTYKWVATARMPLVEIPAFERACGAVFVSQSLAVASGHLMVKAPTADGLSQLDFARVQCQVAKAMMDTAQALVDNSQAPQAIAAVSQAINSLLVVQKQLAGVAK